MTGAMGTVRRVEIKETISVDTVAHLRRSGRRGLEGMVLWAGRLNGDAVIVEEAIVPMQDARITDHGLIVTVNGDELHRINVHLFRNGLRLIAQVHSHPGRAYHSDVDDEYAVVTEEGAFSIVVPEFAAGDFDLQDYAIYRLQPGRWPWNRRARWKALSPRLTNSLFNLEQQ